MTAPTVATIKPTVAKDNTTVAQNVLIAALA